jgi:hypothetical protein
MKNIKKMMAMLMIVAIMFGGMVFGVSLDDTNILLKTTVNGVSEIGVYPSAITSKAALPTTGVVSEVDLGTIDFSSTSSIVSDTYYLAIRTNQKNDTTLSISFDNMNGTTYYSTNELKFNVNMLVAGSNTTYSSTSSSTASTTITRTIPGGSGLRIYNYPFRFEITSEYYEVASPDTYETTITFNYTSP